MQTNALEILKENNLCVLATCSGNVPNSSLMQYVYDENSMNIFMLTLSGSVKHTNIVLNPQVSLLIDTRTNSPSPGLPVKALTVYGKAEIVEDPRRHQTIVDQLAARFNNLAQLVNDSQCLVIQVNMTKMLLLDGVTDKSTVDVLP